LDFIIHTTAYNGRIYLLYGVPQSTSVFLCVYILSIMYIGYKDRSVIPIKEKRIIYIVTYTRKQLLAIFWLSDWC